MKNCPQPDFPTFIAKFMGLLFEPGDRVALACMGPDKNWSEDLYTREAAIEFLKANRNVPNLYFRASAFGDGSGRTADDCTVSRAVFIDIDYGKAGHKKPCPFKTLHDVVGYLLTMPIRPTIAWHTGHGVQCAFILKEPCALPKGGGGIGNLALYTNTGEALVKMAMADSAFTPEHAYRIPLTINSKGHNEPGLPDIQGSLLWCDNNYDGSDVVRYSLEEIGAACRGYGIPVPAANATATASAATDDPDAEPPVKPVDVDVDATPKACDYDELPEDLRNEIETPGLERSDRLFGLIGSMIRSGYADPSIVEAMGHGSDFCEKFAHRSGGLEREVANCIAKIRGGNYVYSGSVSAPVRIYNAPVSVPLRECGPLPPTLDAMLDAYGKAAGIELLPRVKDAARFHEHLASTRKSGVIESPCGTGKSVWALCHIASRVNVNPTPTANADPNADPTPTANADATVTSNDRYVYVVETVATLHQAADMLGRLTCVPVGRVHGFNTEKCRELSGRDLAWYDCKRGDPQSACVNCDAQTNCSYYTRSEQVRRRVLCMTHAGLIRAIEDGSDILKDSQVIIDEGLSPFDSLTVSYDDLRRMLKAFKGSEMMLGNLFPYTRAASTDMLARYGIGQNASGAAGFDDSDVFASRNYVYRNEKQTAYLDVLVGNLRNLLRNGDAAPMFGTDHDNEKARDTLAALVNFFRPSIRGDATYAYHESRTDDGWVVQCKRSRFDFGTGAWRSMWMLNASASLSPFQYPDNMPVYACPDIPDNSSQVTLHCIKANPTKTRQEEAVRVSQIAMLFGENMRKHRKILVCLDKESGQEDLIRGQIGHLYADHPSHPAHPAHLTPEVMILHRGRIKGSNAAGECTLALLQGMSTFTGINDCALHACLQYKRTFPDTPDVYTNAGKPNWPGGKMKLPPMRNYYALKSLDEIYQAIWRTAVRNDKPVEAVVVVPDESWLAALYRTVMPGYAIGSAYREETGAKTRAKAKPDAKADATATPDTTPIPTGIEKYDWVADDRLYGMGFIASIRPGEEIRKSDVAKRLGYTGDDPNTTEKPKTAWGKHSETIRGLLKGIFEEADGQDTLRRIGGDGA